jgi:signal transduction histidine kinase
MMALVSILGAPGSQQDWEFISMRERIHSIGGEFESWSGPGQGTRITASAPIAKQAL